MQIDEVQLLSELEKLKSPFYFQTGDNFTSDTIEIKATVKINEEYLSFRYAISVFDSMGLEDSVSLIFISFKRMFNKILFDG